MKMLHSEHLLIADTFLEGQDLINRKLSQGDFEKADKNNRHLSLLDSGSWSVSEAFKNLSNIFYGTFLKNS